MAGPSMGDGLVVFFSEHYPDFIATCDYAFDKMDFNKQQHVSSEAAAANATMLFDMLRVSLTEHGISMREPSHSEVMTLFKEPKWDTRRRLTRLEFYQFCANFLRMALHRTAQSAVHEYTPSALRGFFGFVLFRRVLRVVPVVKLASPILGVLPAVIVGPVIGVVIEYKHRRNKAKEYTFLTNKLKALKM